MVKLLLSLIILVSVNCYAAGDFNTLFQSPYSTQTSSSQGKAGSTIASLSQSCQKLKNSPLLPVAQTYFPDFWLETTPVIPFVGVVYALTQQESILFKICDILIQMDAVGTRESIMATSTFVNDLTGKKFDAELAMVDKINYTANSVFDFQSGKQRPGALQNGATHRALKDLGNQSVKYYQTRFKGNERAPGIEEKVDRKAKLDEIARLSYERSILKDATNCPAPRGNTDFQKKYNNFVPERESRLRNAEEEIKFFHQQLLYMGPDFISELDDMQKYANKLNSLVNNGVTYVTNKTKFEQKNAELTGKMQKDGKPQKKDKTVSRTVNTFSIFVVQNLFDEFRSKYVQAWEKFVTSQLLTNDGVFGLFNDKKGRIEAKYKSYSFECSEIQLAPQITPNDKSDPIYRTRLDEERERCQKNLQFRDSNYKNLMDEYLTRMVISMRTKYLAQSEIWNFEAEELGYNRIVGDSPQDRKDANSPYQYQQVDVSCSDKLESSEMSQLKIQAKNNKIALREAWLKQEVEENIREEAKMKGDKDAADLNRLQAEKEIHKASSKAKPSIPAVEIKTDGGL